MICFPCPSCRRLLRFADDLAGGPANCPDCSAAVTVPSYPAPEETAITTAPATMPPALPMQGDPTAVTNRPGSPVVAPPWAAGTGVAHDADYSGWTSVRTGLRLLQFSVNIKIGILIVAILVLAPVFQQLSGRNADDSRSGRPYSAVSPSAPVEPADFQLLMVLAALAAEILQMIGAVFVLQVPESTRCRPLAATMVVCQSLVLAGALLPHARGIAENGLFTLLAQVVAGVAALVMLVVLLVFLYKTGSHLDSGGLCRQVVRFAVSYGVGVGLLVAGGCGLVLAWRESRGSSMTVLAVGIVVILVTVGLLLVMEANLLRQAREVIRRQALRTANDA